MVVQPSSSASHIWCLGIDAGQEPVIVDLALPDKIQVNTF
jgi:hypothetical protein